MRCDPVELNTRPRTAGLSCAGCGCTDDAACPGGCFWVSLEPTPMCSQCLPPDDEAPVEGGLFSAQRCQASITGAGHAPIWLNETSGYCARCQLGFTS
ncbi:hypothetical protein ACVWW6_006062 [Bradyrhizobium sp. USDA 3311]